MILGSYQKSYLHPTLHLCWYLYFHLTQVLSLAVSPVWDTPSLLDECQRPSSEDQALDEVTFLQGKLDRLSQVRPGPVTSDHHHAGEYTQVALLTPKARASVNTGSLQNVVVEVRRRVQRQRKGPTWKGPIEP